MINNDDNSLSYCQMVMGLRKIRTIQYNPKNYMMFERYYISNNKKNTIADSAIDANLLKILDRGIDDVLAGRTLSHKDAMEEAKKIRSQRGING